MNKIAWKKIWEKFEEQMDAAEVKKTCQKCGSRWNDFPEWEDQQTMIQELVETEIKNGTRRNDKGEKITNK